MNYRVTPICCLFLLLLFNSKPLFAQGSGDALDFDNLEYVDCGPAVRTINFPFTIESWVYIRSGAPKAYPIWYSDVVLSDPTYYGVWSVIGITGQAVFTYGDGTGSGGTNRRTMRTVNSIPLDEWVHVAGIWETPTSGNIYINGIAEPFDYTGSGVLSIVDGPTPGISTVGYTNTVTPEAYMKGIVDEVRVWNTARSLTEIREYMCKLVDPTDPDLEAYYRFEDGMGTSLTDESGNGHDGVFVGTPTWKTSAAPLGNESVYTYPGSWAGASLSYALPGGESVTVDTVSGAADGGIHIYFVGDNPNVSSGLSPSVYPWYFGVFGAKTNSYNLKYDLGYGLCDTCAMDMFIRNDNADIAWINNFSDPETIGCKINLIGESMDQDSYRSEYITSVALIATAPCNDTMIVDTMDVDTVIIIDPPIDTSIVIDSLCEILFPNAFSPNNDGLNDTWGGYTPCQVPENYLLQVYDRWGERVFISKNIDQLWDGTYKGKQQHIESYVWLVSYTIDNNTIQEAGNVTIIR